MNKFAWFGLFLAGSITSRLVIHEIFKADTFRAQAAPVTTASADPCSAVRPVFEKTVKDATVANGGMFKGFNWEGCNPTLVFSDETLQLDPVEFANAKSDLCSVFRAIPAMRYIAYKGANTVVVNRAECEATK